MKPFDAEAYLLSLSNLPRRDSTDDPLRRQRSPKRMRRFLTLIGNPETRIPHIIHVTGTSGKGSVATMLASMLTAAGFRTGLMVSPHPTFLRERWHIDSHVMKDKEFTTIVRSLKPAIDQYASLYPADPLSFFELVTAVGLLFFVRRRVAWAVVEVFLGGAHDTTNIFPKKDIAIITNIGRDHLDVIGPTKKDIAREKAGIITRGCRAFTGEQSPTMVRILDTAARARGATLEPVTPAHVHAYHAPLTGAHQITNAALAIRAAESLHIPARAIRRGLSHAKQPLRMETVSRRPMIILDGAHNEDKIAAAVATVRQRMSHHPHSRLHLMIGFSNDKAWRGMIRQLASLSPTSIVCTRNTVNPFRKVAAPGLVARACHTLLSKTNVQAFLDPRDALRWSKACMKKDDILLVTGSIFLSGEIRQYLT